MKKYILVMILIFCIFSMGINAQESPKLEYPTPKVTSPQVASLMKQVDYPISLYTGLINIEIPLYEVVEGDLRLPISLQYHASGIKIAPPDGRFGAGWSLNAEPSLVRDVRGIKDERGGYLSSFRDVNDDWLSMSRGYKDQNPDMFYYKLLNKSGKFHFTKSRNVVGGLSFSTYPFEPLKINYSLSGRDGFQTFTSFSINDEDGTLYRFKDETINGWLINFIQSSNQQHQIDFSFDLKPIEYKEFNHRQFIGIDEMRSGNTRFFENQVPGYESDAWGPDRTLVKFPFMRNDGETFKISSNFINGWLDGIDLEPNFDPMVPYDPFPYPLPETYTSSFEYCLETIQTAYVKVEFLGKESLRSIVVTDKRSNAKIKIINFYYQTNKIKTLERVEILDKNGVVTEKYQFGYNPLRPKSNRDRNRGLDHWGYYNGLDSQFNLIPLKELKTTVYQQLTLPTYIQYKFPNPGDRDANEICMQHSMLTSITYPTGRKSSFFYEAHRYIHSRLRARQYLYEEHYKEDELLQRTHSDKEQQAGGLRIRKIDEYDPVTQSTLTKEYKYGKNESGIGHIARQIDEEDYCTTRYIGRNTMKDGTYRDYTTYVTKMRMYTTSPIPMMAFSNGSTVVYDCVTEYTENHKTGEKFKSISKFDVDSRDYGQRYLEGSGQSYNSEDDWKFGQLLEKTDFRVVNENYQAVLRKEYDYITYGGRSGGTNELITNVSLLTRMIYPGEYYCQFGYDKNVLARHEDGQNMFVSENYQMYSGRKDVSQEITTTYGENGDSSQTVVANKYGYNTYSSLNAKHPFLRESITRKNDGDVSTILYQYPQDYQLTGEEEVARLKLIQHNHINVPLVKTENFSDYSSWKTANKTKTKYKVSPVNGLALPASITTNTGDVIAGTTNRVEEERITILKYDVYNNPIHMIKDGGLHTVYLWGYNGQYLIAEINNVTYDQVKTALGATPESLSIPLVPNMSLVDGLRMKLKDALVSSYTYNPLQGMLTATTPSGIITYYDYDASGRLFETSRRNLDGTKIVMQQYHYNYRNK